MLSLNTTTGTAVAGTADDVKIVSAFTRNSAGTVALQTIDIDVESVKLYDAFATRDRQSRRASSTAMRLGTTGVRDVTASAAVGGTVAAADSYAVSTLTVVGFNDAPDPADAERRRHGDSRNMTTGATTLGAAKKRINIQSDPSRSP